MSKTRTLIDSSFLIAAFAQRESAHERCVAILSDTRFDHLIPDITLVEVSYFIAHTGGDDALLSFMEAVQKISDRFIGLTPDDLQTATRIKTTYREFDFVDCCIMAQAVRLNITHVCTLDVRDFMQYRPRHVEYLTLLPEMAQT
jgi:predicted nucleic acid-binding protein